MAAFEESHKVLRESLVDAAHAWKQNGTVSTPTLDGLDRAADSAESALRTVRESAAARAAEVPWREAVGGDTQLERADGNGGTVGVDSLGGKVVGLYFTASWCGPCRRFSPLLVNLYESARGAARQGKAEDGFEVVVVSWDESHDDKERYAKQAGMRWLALPHANRALADELTLRYDVQFIPTLIVVEISPDGKEAKVLSREGRDEVLQGAESAAWMRRVLASGDGGGASSWLGRFAKGG